MSENQKPEEKVVNTAEQIEKGDIKTRDGKEASPEAKELVKQAIQQKKQETKELTPEEQEKYKKQQEFYRILQCGAYFLKFVNDDLDKMRKQQHNRAERRRIEKAIKKGQITRDVIDLYSGKIDMILEFIDKGLEETKNKQQSKTPGLTVKDEPSKEETKEEKDK